MKKIIVAKDREHLEYLIQYEIEQHGIKCDLNHIDVSHITDMSKLFMHSKFNGNISNWKTISVEKTTSMFWSSEFNGDISKWDTSNVKNMYGMFAFSKFKTDISQWNVSNVQDMNYMFAYSEFNSEISSWNISNVIDMAQMFEESKFVHNLDNWTPYSLKNSIDIFDSKYLHLPKWANLKNNDELCKIINFYHLNKNLKVNSKKNSKLKI